MASDPRTPDTIFLYWNGQQTIWREGRWGHDDVEYVRADVREKLIAELVGACEIARYQLTSPGCNCGAHETVIPILNAAIAKAEHD